MFTRINTPSYPCAISQGSPSTRMSQENLENFGASGDDTARYDDREGEKSEKCCAYFYILERLENRMNHLELCFKSSQRTESSAHALFRQSPYCLQGQSPPHMAESNQNPTPDQATRNPFGPEPVTAGQSGSNEVQERFNSIKSSVDKVILPMD